MTMTEFLLARIAEDEAEASNMLRRAQEHELNCGEPQLLGKRIPGWYDWPHVQVMSSRVLAECEAKRLIIEDYETLKVDYRQIRSPESEGRRFQALVSVAQLARVYADHPDYDEAWRP